MWEKEKEVKSIWSTVKKRQRKRAMMTIFILSQWTKCRIIITRKEEEKKKREIFITKCSLFMLMVIRNFILVNHWHFHMHNNGFICHSFPMIKKSIYIEIFDHFLYPLSEKDKSNFLFDINA